MVAWCMLGEAVMCSHVTVWSRGRMGTTLGNRDMTLAGVICTAAFFLGQGAPLAFRCMHKFGFLYWQVLLSWSHKFRMVAVRSRHRDGARAKNCRLKSRFASSLDVLSGAGGRWRAGVPAAGTPADHAVACGAPSLAWLECTGRDRSAQ